MEIFTLSLPFIPKSGICATIGFFDGVHGGHRYLLEQLRKMAKEKNQKSAVITFRNHPRTCLQADYIPKLLTSTEEKLNRIAQLGIDYCFLLDFTPDLARMTAEEFISRVLSKKLHIQSLLIGYDHRFGKDRSNGFKDYVRFGQSQGMEVIQAKELHKQKDSISSTLIRHKIRDKAIEEANECLGQPYTLEGKVVRGNQLGQKIGFPTANLEISEPEKLIPPVGIYAVRTHVDGRKYPGMAYIGKRPTVSNEGEERVEVHIIGFSGDLYNSNLQMEFIRFLRDDRRFNSLEELKKQLEIDKEGAESANAIFGNS